MNMWGKLDELALAGRGGESGSTGGVRHEMELTRTMQWNVQVVSA